MLDGLLLEITRYSTEPSDKIYVAPEQKQTCRSVVQNRRPKHGYSESNYNHLIFDKMSKLDPGEKLNLQQVVLGKLDAPHI